MPAPFTASLCGYRNQRPNTSDASDNGSVELGTLFFDAMGVPRDAPPPETVGNLLVSELAVDLQQKVSCTAPHLEVRPELPLTQFEQYAHLSSSRDLRSDMSADIIRAVSALDLMASEMHLDAESLQALTERKDKIIEEVQAAERNRLNLLNILGEESLLKLDVTVSREVQNPITPTHPLDHLVAGFSLKWTLRTDRAQDCRSQGAKMASLRRGRMPHFAAVTMEPRPSMLALLGRGSGDLDCVYHLNLPALALAIDDFCSGSKRSRRAVRDNFNRLREQRRLRDYDELCSYVATL